MKACVPARFEIAKFLLQQPELDINATTKHVANVFLWQSNRKKMLHAFLSRKCIVKFFLQHECNHKTYFNIFLWQKYCMRFWTFCMYIFVTSMQPQISNYAKTGMVCIALCLWKQHAGIGRATSRSRHRCESEEGMWLGFCVRFLRKMIKYLMLTALSKNKRDSSGKRH